MKQRTWRPQLTETERRQGWVFFALYLLIFPFLLPTLLGLVDSTLEVYLSSAATENTVYYLIVAVLLVVVFWAFLKHGFFLLIDWLPENLFALGTGLAGCAALTFLVGLIPLPVENPVFTDYPQQFALSPGGTIAVVVLLRPLVEEVLFRGLLFTSLRRSSRLLAYAVTVPLFALCAVWQFAFPQGGAAYLLLALQYLPMSLALTWCYDNGGSIWSPVLLRMVLAGIGLALIIH